MEDNGGGLHLAPHAFQRCTRMSGINASVLNIVTYFSSITAQYLSHHVNSKHIAESCHEGSISDRL